jgi:DNA excision repair protein ERCC-2
LKNLTDKITLKPGVYTIEELKEYGKEHKLCPYFLARMAIQSANVVIYNYHYLLDPKVAEMVSKTITKDAIIVFDEAHNIDNICIEALSVDLNRSILDASSKSLKALEDIVTDISANSKDRLEEEYKALVEGLREANINRISDNILSNPVLPDDIFQEAIPGNIRKAQHFIHFLNRFVEFLKTKLKVMHVVSETPLSFLINVKEMTYIDQKPLKFCSERLSSLIKTLKITNLDEYSSLQKVTTFATIVSTYLEGFLLIMEPFEGVSSNIFNPTLHLCCMDASIAIKPVFSRFKSVVITSGTLSPMDIYPKILDFHPTTVRSFQMSLPRNCFNPIVITRGSDQVAVSSKFQVRTDPSVVRNYGSILIEFAKCVPDGLVAFFPSYLYMETIVTLWNEMKLLDKVLKYKLLFIETPDIAETSMLLLI